MSTNREDVELGSIFNDRERELIEEVLDTLDGVLRIVRPSGDRPGIEVEVYSQWFYLNFLSEGRGNYYCALINGGHVSESGRTLKSTLLKVLSRKERSIRVASRDISKIISSVNSNA